MRMGNSLMAKSELPQNLAALFWDCDFSSIDLQRHRSFIIRRILEQGNWQALSWLRQTLGDRLIREWFLKKQGGGLDPRRLRFWGLVLDLPIRDVDAWVRKARANPWQGKSKL